MLRDFHCDLDRLMTRYWSRWGDIAEGKALGDTTTLADPAVVAKLKEQYESQE